MPSDLPTSEETVIAGTVLAAAFDVSRALGDELQGFPAVVLVEGLVEHYLGSVGEVLHPLENSHSQYYYYLRRAGQPWHYW